MQSIPLLFPLLTVLVLILLSAFFSGSETGLIGAARAKIYKLKSEGNKRADQVARLREDKEGLIGTILLGNNLVNIGASALATSLAIEIFGQRGVIWTTGVMTVVVLIFAEVLPKTFAVRHAEWVALLVAPIFILLTKVFAPFTKTIQLVVNRLINLVSPSNNHEMSGVELLRGAVDMYHKDGDVEKDDKDMLSGIFDLDKTDVSEVMVHRTEMETLSINLSIEEVLKHFMKTTYSRIPFWKGKPDKIVGILHTKDLFKALQNKGLPASGLEIEPLLRKVMFVPETTSLKNQLKTFKEKHQHIAMVVDEFGVVTGLVTLEDILEEVVGEIEDEHDGPQRKLYRICRDGSVNIDGDLSIRDWNKFIEWKLPDEEANTVAGLIMHEAQRIPEEGEEIESSGIRFKVIKKLGNQLKRIKIIKKEKQDDENDIHQETAE